MKKIFILFIFFSVIKVCKSQETKSFVDTTKIWSIVYQAYGLGLSEAHTISYLMKEKKIINNNVYTKLYVCFDSLLNDWHSTDTLLRESSKKVYLKTSSNIDDRLIYDFNLKVADSIRTRNNWWSYVKSVDSILVNGTYKKKLTLNLSNGDNEDIWIESIGSVYDSFNPGGFYGNGAMTNSLLCVRDIQDHNVVYSSLSNKCYLSYCTRNGINCSTIVESNVINQIRIYPTLTNNVLKIETQIESYRLTISNILGKVLKEGNFTKDISIDCNFLNSGIYVVKIKTPKETFTQKIIKMK